jgi:hypothetical protein
MDYNTQRKHLNVPEYGRNIQMLVEYIVNNIKEKEERTRAAYAVVNLMAQQNPQLRNQPEFLQKIWDHIHIIANYQLDVDSPYPPPEPLDKNAIASKKPAYPQRTFKYHFYGENIELMIKQAILMEEGEQKSKYVQILASYMKYCYRNWNDDKVSDDIIIRHLGELSKGLLTVDKVDDLIVNSKQGPVNKPFQKDYKKFKGRTNQNYKRNR